MDFLRTFFSLNREIIYFGYGLVFFILGLAIALQSRNSSRLDLARSLNWLAAFGFMHGLNEWGDLFIPIQAKYLSPELIHSLNNFHLLLLAGSFACLFEFGVTLLKPLGRMRWLYGFSGGLLAIWFFIAFYPVPALFTQENAALNVGNALARYMIGFPAAILSAYALRQHTHKRIAPLNVPHIIKTLRFAGLMLAGYAFLGGLIPPPVPFFPGNILNDLTFERTLGIPVPVFRSIVGLGLAVAIIRALEVFNLETARLIDAMQQKQLLLTERDRLGRELHDGAIQKVYTAGLLVESAQKLADQENPQLATRLEKAETVLNDAIRDLRRNLGELRDTSDVDEPFPEALRNLIEDPRFRSLVDLTVDINLPAEEDLSPVRTGHVLSIVNEALSNIVRHSKASRAKVTARSMDGKLQVVIEDNGVGMPSKESAGYGLRNMRDRARLLGGQITFNNLNGKGTRIVLDIPWRDER